MSGALLRNLLLFGRVLRNLGLDVNAGRMLDLVAALPLISIGRRSDFYYAARGHRFCGAGTTEHPHERWGRPQSGPVHRRWPPRAGMIASEGRTPWSATRPP